MKKKTVALLLALVLVFGAAVGGTIAYLTDSTGPVTNTFTVGKVAITLDEAKVDEYGAVDTTATARVDANTYKLIPGHTYTKDPTVHFTGKSEASWLFVKVENGIAAYEANAEGGYKTIAQQIADNGWTALGGVSGVYYKSVAANTSDTAVDYPVFAKFMVSDTANTKDGWDDITAENTKITVTACAVQSAGLTTADAAYEQAPAAFKN